MNIGGGGRRGFGAGRGGRGRGAGRARKRGNNGNGVGVGVGGGGNGCWTGSGGGGGNGKGAGGKRHLPKVGQTKQRNSDPKPKDPPQQPENHPSAIIAVSAESEMAPDGSCESSKAKSIEQGQVNKPKSAALKAYGNSAKLKTPSSKDSEESSE